MEINSLEFWNNEFSSGNWLTGIPGDQQTAYFMHLLLDNLPEKVTKYLSKKYISILDWGCALGQGVKILSDRFPFSSIWGLDFSEEAIRKAQELFPLLSFRTKPLDMATDYFDVILTSNVLEHYHDPFEWLQKLLQCTRKYCTILVPYNQPPQDHHFFQFTEESFPGYLSGFWLTHLKVIPSQGNDLWNAEQILGIYERR